MEGVRFKEGLEGTPAFVPIQILDSQLRLSTVLVNGSSVSGFCNVDASLVGTDTSAPLALARPAHGNSHPSWHRLVKYPGKRLGCCTCFKAKLAPCE